MDKKQYETLELNAHVNKKSGEAYKGDFDSRCKNNKVGKRLSKLTDDDLKSLYDIVHIKPKIIKTIFKLYVKNMNSDLSDYLIAKEVIDRGLDSCE